MNVTKLYGFYMIMGMMADSSGGNNVNRSYLIPSDYTVLNDKMISESIMNSTGRIFMA
jgi:hypothetical protein